MIGAIKTSLEEYIEQKVRTLSTTNSRVFCHVLTDMFHNHAFTEASPKARSSEYLKYHHIILLFQEKQRTPANEECKKAANGHQSKPSSFLIMGMSVFEYCEWQNPSQVVRSYIQYIDTTGLFEPREDQSFLTKSVVSSYISYMQHVAKAQFIHLFATAKPNYLFAGSEFIASKKELSTEKLVSWWLKVIAFSVDNPSQIYTFAPGEWEDEEDVQTRVFGSLPAKEGVEYVWGLPFNDTEPINMAIPLFEDDPKWKHYQKYMERKVASRPYVYAEEESEYSQPFNTQESQPVLLPSKVVNVREFVSTLSARPEFVMEPEATFIVIKFPKNEPPKTKSNNHLAGLANKMLKDLTFEDEDHVLSSSSKILSWLKFMGSKPVDIHTSDQSIEEHRKKAKTNNSNDEKKMSPPRTYKNQLDVSTRNDKNEDNAQAPHSYRGEFLSMQRKNMLIYCFLVKTFLASLLFGSGLNGSMQFSHSNSIRSNAFSTFITPSRMAIL